MNIKRTLINSTSNLLTVTALVGAVAFASPAKADLNQLNQFIQILSVLQGNTQQGTVGNNYNNNNGYNNNNYSNNNNQNNSLSRCGFFTNVEYQGAQATITKMNRCTGQVVERTVKNRYND
jgi:hypothetical protein